MKIGRGLSLRTQLYLLVLMVFIPLGVLTFFTAEEQKQVEKETIFKGVTLLASAAAIEEQQQLNAAGSVLATISDWYSLNAGRTDLVQDFLLNLKKRFPGYVDLGIIDGQGWWVAGVRPPEQYAGYHQKTWFLRCLEKQVLTIGDYGGDGIDGTPVLYVAIPVAASSGTAGAVLFAGLDLKLVNRTTLKLLAEISIVARLYLIDAETGTLCFDAGTKQWSHQDDFGAALLGQIRSRPSGTVTAGGPEGEAYIYAFTMLNSPIRDRQVYVALALPEDKALASSLSVFRRNMAVLLLFGLLALLIIWWVGDVFILRRVRKMVDTSRGIASGDLSVRVGDIGGHDELTHLAGAFDEMAAALQQRRHRERQVMAQLSDSREQLRNLAAYQQQALENERIRIARELHDEFGQSLTILKMDLAWVKKKLPPNQTAAFEKIETMFQVIDDALKTLHSVMAELRPVILDDFGLAAAIDWQAEEFRKRTGILCEADTSGFTGTLAKEMTTAVFRICQELLTNVARHAEAHKVQISLQVQGGALTLKVADDGRGITETQVKGAQSYGLIGIRERLYPWNGEVTFQGRSGRGTEVIISIPYKQDTGASK